MDEDVEEPLTQKVEPCETLVLHSHEPSGEASIRAALEANGLTPELVTRRFSIFTFPTKEEAAEAYYNFNTGEVGGAAKCDFFHHSLSNTEAKGRLFICREPSSVVWVNVLFDWDSCPLRPFESATEFREMLVQHLSPSLGEDYRIRKLRMYGTKLRSTDPEKILIRQLASSHNTNVKSYAVPHPPRRPGKKKPVPSVYLMHLKILRYIIKFRPPFPVAIFSADVEMNQPIQELKKRNYLVITASLPKS